MGSDVYGLPSQETYLDSQKFHSDAAKISIFLLSSKHFRIFFTQRTFLSKFFRPFATSIAESTVNGVGFARSTPCYTSYQILCDEFPSLYSLASHGACPLYVAEPSLRVKLCLCFAYARPTLRLRYDTPTLSHR